MVKLAAFFSIMQVTKYYFFDAYNEDTSSCEAFNIPDASVVERREFRCLRFDDYVVTQKEGEEDTRFISQDPSKYFWWFICLDGNVRSFASCNSGFFDLNIPRNFELQELDLTGLPWD